MKAYKLYIKTVKLIMCGILLWLISLSFVSTSYITKGEHTFYLMDSPVFLIVILAGALLGLNRINKLACIKKIKKELEDEFKFKKVKCFILITQLISTVLWVLCTQLIPGGDQYRVLEAAYGLDCKDYTMFMENGYIALYPNQIGLVVIYYLLSFAIGNYNYIFWQFFNAICVCLICKALSEIGEKFGLDKVGQLCVLGLGLCFFPLAGYASFVYGTIPGLMFALYAMKFEFKFYESYKWIYMVLSGIFISIAMMFKSNYLIFFIGMVIFALLETINRKRIILIGALGIYIFGYLFQSYVPKFFLEQLTGYELDGGASSWSWIVMGIQDTSYYAPGWSNGYNANSYEKFRYDSEAQGKEAKKIIAERIKYFQHNKKEAISFFSKKIASQWNNPTFQCFWIGQVRNTNIKTNSIVSEILWGSGAETVIQYLNILQSLILLGALFSVNGIDAKRENSNMTLFQMIFIGGFVFHLFWEGKCQYILPYFVLLLPLSVKGYFKWQKNSDYILKINHQKNKKSVVIKRIAGMVCVIAFMWLMKICDLPDERKDYEQYLNGKGEYVDIVYGEKSAGK